MAAVQSTLPGMTENMTNDRNSRERKLQDNRKENTGDPDIEVLKLKLEKNCD